MKPIALYQGEDKTIVVEMNTDLSAATEIEFSIDTPSRITKTLSAAQISAVTATQFSVQMDAADTETAKAGPYKYQGRATISGKTHNIRFIPNKIKILDSVFVDSNVTGDYGS